MKAFLIVTTAYCCSVQSPVFGMNAGVTSYQPKLPPDGFTLSGIKMCKGPQGRLQGIHFQLANANRTEYFSQTPFGFLNSSCTGCCAILDIRPT